MIVRRGLLMLLLVLSPLAAQKQSPIPLQLDIKEKQLEELYPEYWRAEYNIARGDEYLSSRPVQERIRMVMSDEKFLHDLKLTRLEGPLVKAAA